MKRLNNAERPIRSLATAALASASLFPVIVIALNVVQRRDYNPTRQAISELALGNGGDFMVLAFCGLGLGIFLLGLVIFHTSRRARLAPLLLVVASVLAGPVSAAFHTDRTGAPTTTHGDIHNAAGLAAFVLILLAMITAAYRFRHEPNWRSDAAPTTALATLGIVTFLLIPVLGDSHFGLAQRLFVGTFVVWVLTCAAHARQAGTAGPATRASSRDSREATSPTVR